MVRLTDRPDMTLDVYRGRKTTIQQQYFQAFSGLLVFIKPIFKKVPLVISHKKSSIIPKMSCTFLNEHSYALNTRFNAVLADNTELK